MLTRTQTKHQIINHVIGCNHDATDGDVDLATDLIIQDRNNGKRITTVRLCSTIEYAEML